MRRIFSEFGTERGLAVFAGTILVLTLLGPFGSYEAMSLGLRFVFWTATVTSVALPMHVAMHYCITSRRLARWPRVAQIALGSAIAAVPGAGLVYFICAILWPGAFDVAELPVVWFQVMAVGFVIGCFHFLDFGAPEADPQARPPAPEPDTAPAPRVEPVPTAAAPKFLTRMTPTLGSDIISLTMQDHYVEVTTTRGNQLILIRFSDALDELEPIEGLRLHRSHWAARAHLTGMIREDGKLRATLSDGRSLPVSRTYAPDLRELFPD
ncbi:LytTR family transcriptional regulator DNA-binding domain-containing protein [Pseudooceanicola sp. LIPI14-2-Ac024]|uniref:LytTR family transcriptional regulator DNA-binding domain-containing protein n=1 Tax=Pseudooceanicola sp. LIPI14-2-Ac024 TaxID=3344875 RepID=UPI0035D1007E